MQVFRFIIKCSFLQNLFVIRKKTILMNTCRMVKEDSRITWFIIWLYEKNGSESVFRNDQGLKNAQINCSVLVHISQCFSFLFLFMVPTASVFLPNK